MTTYSIERTASTVYLNDSGQAVQGYLVFVRLDEYDELHELRVPNLNPKTVETSVNKLVTARDALTKLGRPSK